jgi:hypothetical protein
MDWVRRCLARGAKMWEERSGKKWVAGLRDICILLHIDRATVLQDGHTYKQFAYY